LAAQKFTHISTRAETGKDGKLTIKMDAGPAGYYVVGDDTKITRDEKGVTRE
jgi:hypothetical protein